VDDDGASADNTIPAYQNAYAVSADCDPGRLDGEGLDGCSDDGGPPGVTAGGVHDYYEHQRAVIKSGGCDGAVAPVPGCGCEACAAAAAKAAAKAKAAATAAAAAGGCPEVAGGRLLSASGGGLVNAAVSPRSPRSSSFLRGPACVVARVPSGLNLKQGAKAVVMNVETGAGAIAGGAQMGGGESPTHGFPPVAGGECGVTGLQMQAQPAMAAPGSPQQQQHHLQQQHAAWSPHSSSPQQLRAGSGSSLHNYRPPTASQLSIGAVGSGGFHHSPGAARVGSPMQAAAAGAAVAPGPAAEAALPPNSARELQQ